MRTSSENVTSRFCNPFSIIQSHYAWKIKCVLTIRELNWNQRLGHKKTKLNICHHMLTSSTELQNRSFHVVERTRTSSKCQKLKNARAKRAKMLFFIVKYANLWGFCCRRRRGCLSSLLQYGPLSTGRAWRSFRGIKFVVMQVVTIVTFKSKWAKETRIIAYRTRLSKGHSFILQDIFVLGLGILLQFVSLSWVRDIRTLVASNPSRGQLTPFFTILFMLCYVN